MRLGINLALTSALKTIAAIDPSNQAETRTWRELAAVAVGTARAAVAGFERVEEGKVNQALMEIAKMDPVVRQYLIQLLFSSP